MTDPLKFINHYRAKVALRPLNPERPAGQTEPWTQFDIEHYALALGWEPPPGYKLACDPRKTLSPTEWWTAFFERYYVPGGKSGSGTVSIAHNFGGARGVVEMGEMIRNAEIEPKPGLPHAWPDRSAEPEEHRAVVIYLVRFVEKHNERWSMASWPLSDVGRESMINNLGLWFGGSCPPQNLTRID